MRSTLAHTSSDATKSPRVGRRDAVLYRLGEACILVEKAGDRLLGEFVHVAAIACREYG
jgi:hypothetical protein